MPAAQGEAQIVASRPKSLTGVPTPQPRGAMRSRQGAGRAPRSSGRNSSSRCASAHPTKKRQTAPNDRDHRVPSTCSYCFSLGGSTIEEASMALCHLHTWTEEHWGGSVRWLDSGDEHSKPPQHPPQEKPAASSTGGRRLEDSSIYDLTNYTKGRPVPQPPCLRDPAEDCLKAAQQRHGPKTAQLHQPKFR